MVITAEWIMANTTAAGGWTRKQLEAVGVDWPPVKGWKQRILGTEISADQQSVFESFAAESTRDGFELVLQASGYYTVSEKGDMLYASKDVAALKAFVRDM